MEASLVQLHVASGEDGSGEDQGQRTATDEWTFYRLDDRPLQGIACSRLVRNAGFSKKRKLAMHLLGLISAHSGSDGGSCRFP